MKGTIYPDKDLKGATPETLARALLRPKRQKEAVAGDKVSVKQGKTINLRTHKRKRP